MLKVEKYKESIKEVGYNFALVKGEIKGCQIVDCESCEFFEVSNCIAQRIKWLLEEYKEPILTDKEKACLKKIIKSKRDSVIYISKIAFLKGTENEFTNIVIATKSTLEAVSTSGMPFEGMELEREYTIEDLKL